MQRSKAHLLAILALAAGAPGALPAQTVSRAGPAFVVFRYASRSAVSMYGGYAAGSTLLVFGMLQNPRTDYREVLAGVGRPVFTSRDAGLVAALAGAHTNSGWFAQLYLMPEGRLGRFDLSATVQLAAPLEEGGTWQAYGSPVVALANLGGGLAAGVTYYVSAETGSATGQAAGPAIRLTVPRGSVTLELVRGLTATRDEMRVGFRSSL
jgi:hypothetical protein